MSWLGRLFGQKQCDIRLIGTWYSDPSDADGHNAYGQAEMQFEPDEKLTYTLFEQDGRAGIMNPPMAGWFIPISRHTPIVKALSMKFHSTAF